MHVYYIVGKIVRCYHAAADWQLNKLTTCKTANSLIFASTPELECLLHHFQPIMGTTLFAPSSPEKRENRKMERERESPVFHYQRWLSSGLSVCQKQRVCVWKFYPRRALPSNFRNNSFRCLDDIGCPEAHRRLQDVGDPQKSTTSDEPLSFAKTKKRGRGLLEHKNMRNREMWKWFF